MKKRAGAAVVLAIVLVLGLSLFFISREWNLNDNNVNTVSAKVSNHFGVDGSDLEQMSEIAKLGDGVAGVNGVEWGKLEPLAPSGGKNNYNPNSFEKLDEVLNAVAKNGRVAQINVLFGSPWAMEYSSDITYHPVTGTQIKKLNRVSPEYMDDWSKFITKLISDYPQIKYIQIGSEEENAWENASGYSEALCEAYRAAKATNPNVKVLAAGFNLAELFDLSESEIANIREQSKTTESAIIKNIGHDFDFIEGVIREGKGCFDVLTIHPSGRETSIPPMLEWYNQQMSNNGYTRPIWSDDTASGPGVGGTKPLAGEEKMFELMNSDKLRTNLVEYSRLMEIQSSLLVKKSVTLFVSGAERVMISCDVDFMTYFMKPWRYLGLIDGVKGIKKPAYYTYKLLIDKIDAFTSVQEIQENVFKFNLANGNKIFVAWSQINKSIDLSSEIPGDIKITHIISSLDKEFEPVYRENEIISSNSIYLSQEPIFIEESLD